MSDALSSVCFRLAKTIRSLGPFEGKQSAQLNRATVQIEGISQKMIDLITLLARSRSVELEVMERQFGRLIAPDLMDKIKTDLADLGASLKANLTDQKKVE